jgi:hypothetical protein
MTFDVEADFEDQLEPRILWLGQITADACSGTMPDVSEKGIRRAPLKEAA